MKVKEFVDKLKDIANNYKTLYVLGSIGSPMTATNKTRYISQHCAHYNGRFDRKPMIQKATSDTFGFDCVCLIKAVLWGWSGNQSHTYGGAAYGSNGVPDVGADEIILRCSDVSNNFSTIEVGELVWMKGHVGIYIGDGLAVECTPAWKNCVQITACNCYRSGYNRRNWTKHGKLPYIEYDSEKPQVTTPSQPNVNKIYWKVGDVVNFTGTKHYISSNSTNGKTCKPGKATIRALSLNSKHPVQLIATKGGGSTVYGWVDVAFIARENVNLAVGSRVKVNAGAKTYTGGRLAPFVYQKTYDVIRISGDRVVIGIGTTITAAVNKNDLTIV